MSLPQPLKFSLPTILRTHQGILPQDSPHFNVLWILVPIALLEAHTKRKPSVEAWIRNVERVRKEML